MLTILGSIAECLLILVLLGNVAWPWARGRSHQPAETVLLLGALSAVAVYLYAWTLYIFQLPNELLFFLPVFGATGYIVQRARLVSWFRDPETRSLGLIQGALTIWCLGWLCLVKSYSGGGWTADWYEHWERAQFFLQRQSVETLFLGHYTLTARPPLANVNLAGLLFLTRNDFAHYQVFMTATATLAFAPAALFATRWRPGRNTVYALGILCMGSPFFLQNSTFPWTKLPTAFFVLTALYIATGRSPTRPVRGKLCLGAIFLGAALLTHYSAGPYLLILISWWLSTPWRRRSDPAWWRASGLAAVLGLLLLASWFGWAAFKLGIASTFTANTTVRGSATRIDQQVVRMALNLRDTVIPHFLRPLDRSLLAQSSPWGALRDFWFQLYQLNLYFIFGITGGGILVMVLARAWRNSVESRLAWGMAIAAAIVLGVAVNGSRDVWGLAQICLQPLALLGLAFLASRWPVLSRRARQILGAGLVIDFVFGILLQFLIENYTFHRFAPASEPPDKWLLSYNSSATMNLFAKVQHHLMFLGDLSHHSGFAAILLLLTSAATVYTAIRSSGGEGQHSFRPAESI